MINKDFIYKSRQISQNILNDILDPLKKSLSENMVLVSENNKVDSSMMMSVVASVLVSIIATVLEPLKINSPEICDQIIIQIIHAILSEYHQVGLATKVQPYEMSILK